ncbi:MAG: cobalamin B12-binding domain-containing protein [Myxococcaceae bacterium]
MTESARFLEALLAGRREECRDIVDGLLAAGVTPRVLYVELFHEALYEVGRLWEQGLVTVMLEHRATAIVEGLMGHLFPAVARQARVGKRALVSCAADEFHQVGGRIVADTLEGAGWDVDFLGANGSLETLRSRVAGTRFDLVALSVSVSSHVPKLVESVAAVRRADASVPIIVGGRALLDSGASVVAGLGLSNVRWLASLDQLDEFLKEL